ncbi:MAG: hypothetical protein IK064_06810 [Clostridia bacterium]|nr:hypothetical protein [Clostridia bacterium]
MKKELSSSPGPRRIIRLVSAVLLLAAVLFCACAKPAVPENVHIASDTTSAPQTTAAAGEAEPSPSAETAPPESFTEAPAADTEAPVTDSEAPAEITEAPVAVPTQKPGIVEFFDYFSGTVGAGTAAELAAFATAVPETEAVPSSEFPDAYYEGIGLMLGLNLSADELSSSLLLANAGNTSISVGGLRLGMSLAEVASLYPNVRFTANGMQAYFNTDDLDWFELYFSSNGQLSRFIYSISPY